MDTRRCERHWVLIRLRDVKVVTGRGPLGCEHGAPPPALPPPSVAASWAARPDLGEESPSPATSEGRPPPFQLGTDEWQDLVQKRQIWSRHCLEHLWPTSDEDSPNNHMSCRNEELVVRGTRVTPTWDGHVARLELDNLQHEDAGVYTCVAENELGRTRCSAELRVLDTLDPSDEDRRPPEFIQGLPETTAVLEGHSVELQVWLRGTPPLDVVWVKDDLEVPDCQDFRYVDRGDGRVALRLTDVFPQDAGQYHCEAFNDHGDATTATRLAVQEGSSSEASLSRLGPATTHLQFDKRPGPVLARIGGKASFCARVACADVVWSVAGASVTESSRFKYNPLTPQYSSISPHHPVSQYIPSPSGVSVYPLPLSVSVYPLTPQCLTISLAPHCHSIIPFPSVSQYIPSPSSVSIYPLTPVSHYIPCPSLSQYNPLPLTVSVYPLTLQCLSISPSPQCLSISPHPSVSQYLSISPRPSLTENNVPRTGPFWSHGTDVGEGGDLDISQTKGLCVYKLTSSTSNGPIRSTRAGEPTLTTNKRMFVVKEWSCPGHELSPSGRIHMSAEYGVACLTLREITADDSGKCPNTLAIKGPGLDYRNE
uniref:Ig-like domain-containing protein n=1 Tax=Timema poppense TaxID=170557 RepID=A0A7R9H8W0_TIMPO|nr:unnamed protein product [Timema poppensis]